MKSWLKWLVFALVLAALAAGAWRLVSNRQAQKVALEAQQAAQKTQAVVELSAADLVQLKTIDLVQGLAIAGPLRAANTAFVKARVAGELQGLTLREGDRVTAGQVVARTHLQLLVRIEIVALSH